MSEGKYQATIGIETHVQLNTKTKLFSAVANDATNAPPNTLISHIDAGLPGALPVLNKNAIDLCVQAAYALGTVPQKFSKFERKHYFYPDLPKGYQITQFENPIILDGCVEIKHGGKNRKIAIERANLEEDAGKNSHPDGSNYSLVDLNRAGTPLLEIVSRPEIHSPAEAKAYVRELYLLMKYAQITDGDLYHGHMRFDINISLAKPGSELGTRSEVKNLNSFRSVEAAAAFEIERQRQLLEKGQKVIQETRGWDESKQKTLSQRSKEEAEDYRYMPEPDIPPLQLEEDYLKEVQKNMRPLPKEIREHLSKIEVSDQVIEDILDRRSTVEPILDVLKKAGATAARRVAFWLMSAEPTDAVLGDALEPEVDGGRLISLSAMVDSGELSSTAAKTVFKEILSSSEEPKQIANRLNLLQVTDEAAIEEIVTKVLTDNPEVVTQIKNGEQKAIGFLVGKVMSASKGKANPTLTQKLIRKQIDADV